MLNSDILAQLQQIQQFVAQSSDLGGNNSNFNADKAQKAGSGQDLQKQDNTAAAFGMDSLGGKTEFYKGESGGMHGRQQTDGEFLSN